MNTTIIQSLTFVTFTVSEKTAMWKFLAPYRQLAGQGSRPVGRSNTDHHRDSHFSCESEIRVPCYIMIDYPSVGKWCCMHYMNAISAQIQGALLELSLPQYQLSVDRWFCELNIHRWFHEAEFMNKSQTVSRHETKTKQQQWTSKQTKHIVRSVVI